MAITQQAVPKTLVLELDGTHAGWLDSAAGGFPMSEVVEEKSGRQHVGEVKYSDLELGCGTGMQPALYSWISSTLQGPVRRFGWPKDGAVIAFDDSTVRSRLAFTHAWLSEIRSPALDEASTDTAQLTVKLSPKFTQEQGRQVPIATPGGWEAVDGASVGSPPGPGQAQWLLSNFLLKIDGLNCSRVSRVEPVVITTTFSKPSPAPLRPGESRTWEKQPVALDFSDLVVTLPEADAQTFSAWHADLVRRGVPPYVESNPERWDPSWQKSGTLEFRTTLNQTLFTLSFSGLGIYKLAPEESEAGSQNITAWMYCQEVGFSTGAPEGAVAPATPTAEPASPAQPVLSSPGTQREAPEILVAGDYPERFTRLRPTE